MTLNRRQFLHRSGVAAAAASMGSAGPLASCTVQAPPPEAGPFVGPPGIGICDWNLGPMCDPEQIPRAASADLTGIQVSLGRDPDQMLLRNPELRQRYVELGAEFGVSFQPDIVTDPVENVGGNANWPWITMIEAHPVTEGVSAFGVYAGCCVSTESPSEVLATGGDNASSSMCPTYPTVMAVYDNIGRAVFCGDITPCYPGYDITEEHWQMLANTAEWLAFGGPVATEAMGWSAVKSLYR